MSISQLEFAGEVIAPGEKADGRTGVLRQFIEFLKVERAAGGLVPVQVAAQLLGVSQERVCQFLSEGTLTAYRWPGCKKRYVGADELRAFAQLERTRGGQVGRMSAKMDFRELYDEFRENFPAK